MQTAPPYREMIFFLVVYAVLYLAWNLTGGSFRVYPDLWQLLPWPPLLDDLGRSLLDLHGQPPLLNLLFGLALKVSARFGVSVEILLQPVFFLIGAVSVASLSFVSSHIVHRPYVRRTVLLLIIANPYFQAVHNYMFYTAWEICCLSLIALFTLRYFEHPTPSRFAAILAPAVLLVYTRSLFHPLWFALLMVLLLLLGRRSPQFSGLRLQAVACVVALILVAVWPLKNLARFGFFGLSSWSGLSMARGLPTGEPLLPSGYPARLAAFARSGPEPPDPSSVAAAQSMVPPRFRGSPVLAEITKPDGSPNWNHYAMIPLSRQLGVAAVEQLRRDPWLLPLKAVDFYLNGYSVYEARWPYERGLAPEMTTGDTWAGLYELVVFQRFRPYDPTVTRISTGFAITFPVLMIAAGIVLWRRPWGATEGTVVVMLLSIAWVLALVLFVDGPEGNRVRFSTEPYLFLVAGWLLGRMPAGRMEPTGQGDIGHSGDDSSETSIPRSGN